MMNDNAFNPFSANTTSCQVSRFQSPKYSYKKSYKNPFIFCIHQIPMQIHDPWI